MDEQPNSEKTHKCNLPPEMMLPGHEGRGGRPKGKVSLTNSLRKQLEENPEDVEGIVRKQISLALKGKKDAVQLIYDRIDGKVADTNNLNLSGTIEVVSSIPRPEKPQ